MNSILDFVQSLQEMKKSQTKWAGLSIEERSQSLQGWAAKARERAFEWAKLLEHEEGLASEFLHQAEILPSLSAFDEAASKSVPSGLIPKATGLITVLLPDHFAFRVMSERIAPALMAGNGLYVLVPPSQSQVAELFQAVLDPAWPVRILVGEGDLAEMMAAHPGVHAVTMVGTPERVERISKALAGSSKKLQLTGGYHNSALVLNEAELAATAQKLVDSCFVGMGQLPWNISTIYVTEAQLAAFQKEFVEALSKASFGSMSEEAQKRVEKLSEQLKSEKAKVLFGGGPGQPLVVEDLSHCSVLQQDCLAAPVVLISPVKYAHEMVKWTNTSYYGMYAQIFGPAEKIEKFASQLEVSRISANGWIESMKTLPLGLKQSFHGIPDVEPFGGFFSDLRKIDGLESKS